MTKEQVILNIFLISLEQDSHIFDGRLTVDEYINLKSAIASAIKALGEQRQHSEWLPMITKDDYGEEVLGYKCKKCGWIKPHDKMPFCENCGADMRKKRDGTNVSQVVVDEWIGEKESE